MYIFTPEVKDQMSELTKHLFNKFYMNPIQLVVEERERKGQTKLMASTSSFSKPEAAGGVRLAPSPPTYESHRTENRAAE